VIEVWEPNRHLRLVETRDRAVKRLAGHGKTGALPAGAGLLFGIRRRQDHRAAWCTPVSERRKPGTRNSRARAADGRRVSCASSNRSKPHRNDDVRNRSIPWHCAGRYRRGRDEAPGSRDSRAFRRDAARPLRSLRPAARAQSEAC
jgi:hypothetical protein